MSADVDKYINNFWSTEIYGTTMLSPSDGHSQKRKLNISDKRWISKKRKISTDNTLRNKILEPISEAPTVEYGSNIFRNVFPKLNGITCSQSDSLISATDLDSVLPDIDPGQNTRTIYVHETYQLGYVDETRDEKDRLFVFDFVDTLEVGYPVSMSSPDALPIDLPPLFVEAEYVDQLTALANNALEKLAELVESWLQACENADRQLVIWKHVTAHRQSLSLRTKVFQLINALVPDLNILDKVDLHSVRTDMFILQLISLLQGDEAPKSSPPSEIQPCCVSLCTEPAHCVDFLRSNILRLVHTLLPNLAIPESFDIEHDLEALIEATCRCN